MNFDEAQARAYDRWYETPLGRWVDRCEKEAVLALLPPLEGLRILDAGCGTGNFTLLLAARGARVVGFDRSGAMLAQAKAKATRHFEEAVWVQGDLLKLPFASERFDGVLAILSLDFIKMRQEALGELGRVVLPGGFLVVAVLNRYSLWTLKRKIRAWFKPSLWRDVDFFTTSELTRLLRRTGVWQPFSWRRAVYCPPIDCGWVVKLGPLWERLGSSFLSGAAAFLVVAARKRAAPLGQ